jgi:hypothetical protein
MARRADPAIAGVRSVGYGKRFPRDPVRFCRLAVRQKRTSVFPADGGFDVR